MHSTSSTYHVVVARVVTAQVLVQVGPTVHEARDVRAHRHDEPPDRRELEHRVEGARPEHERGREPEELGDVLHALRRDPAVAVLHQVQQRQRGRLRVGVAPRDLLGAAAVGGGEGH